ncbi:MAG: PilT/PilU family type 4a pilus ATPase [bacterium]|nr:PilT/PilU family type 4a pilus ATPase [bacterium]
MEFDNLRPLLDKVLALSYQQKASDIYIKADLPPFLRITGTMYPVQCEALTPKMTEYLALAIMPAHERAKFENGHPEANFVYPLKHIGRFRVNAYRQKDTVAMVFRRVEEEILDIETLGLHPVLNDLVLERRGMILVTGPTGSGKSTTLASMIKYRKEHISGHIVTIEDPIEYVHTDTNNCLVSQREIGSDTMSFKDALESALRQAPDVLLVGEMRDQASVESAVYFAETGHLVLSTLHANNAVQTIERVLQFFPDEMHNPVLYQLSMNVKAVIAERLIPAIGGGRVPALEIMINNARIQECLRKNALVTIKRELDSFHPEGMQSFDYHLLQLFRQGKITPEDALRNSDNPNDLKLQMKHAVQEMADEGNVIRKEEKGW